LGLGSVGEHTVRAIFKKIDKNHNGTLEMSEAMAAYELLQNLLKSNK
jgi:hypothetical protein